MFLGKGDSSKLSPEEAKTLAHLRRLDETGHIVQWDERKSRAAVRAVETFERWEGVLHLGNSIRNTMVLITFFLAAYWFAGESVLNFLGMAGQ